jgi:hypothetical protein
MKTTIQSILVLALVVVIPVHAAKVVKEVPDNLPGKGFSSAFGFMLGATGGPLGALVSAGVAWKLGGITQETFGLSGRSYQVVEDDGSFKVVRSPNTVWEPGDQVDIKKGRLVKSF